jgi:hypothetical protein
LTPDGHGQLQTETRDWNVASAVIGRFFAVEPEELS